MRIVYTTQFKRDYKRIKKQKRDVEKLKIVIDKLAGNRKLEPKYKDHQLIGDRKGHRDCHIESGLILIYRISEKELVLERFGSHSELFK